MKKIALVMCLIFVWYFAYRGYYGAFTIGPFWSKNKCTEIKNRMQNSASKGWAIETFGCWSDSRFDE